MKTFNKIILITFLAFLLIIGLANLTLARQSKSMGREYRVQIEDPLVSLLTHHIQTLLVVYEIVIELEILGLGKPLDI